MKIQTYLDETVSELLTDYTKINKCSYTRAINNILHAYLTNKPEIKKLQEQNKEQFLRLLNILNQVFRCVYDIKKVNIPSSSSDPLQAAEECLEYIRKSIVTHSSDSQSTPS